jgi:hypothetical protein
VDLSVAFWPLFFVADLIVQPMMLHGITRRAESAAPARAGITQTVEVGDADQRRPDNRAEG